MDGTWNAHLKKVLHYGTRGRLFELMNRKKREKKKKERKREGKMRGERKSTLARLGSSCAQDSRG